MGMGVDVHGSDYTKAARRAVSDALRHSSLHFFQATDKTVHDMHVEVRIAVADPEAIDVDAVGLADLGRRDGYLERQLKRWRRQYEAVQTRELPVVEELHALFSSRIPAQQGVGLVHGDYRFDNTILGADHRVAAVLDWELCTIGDPLADFSWSMMYWTDPGDAYSFLTSPPTLHPAFMRRDEMIALYAKRSGNDVSDLPYFTVFCWWKMACIVEGVYARALAGASGGGRVSSIEGIASRVDGLLEQAAEAARGVV